MRLPPIFVGAPESSRDRASDLAHWARDLPKPRAVLAVGPRWQRDALARGSTAPVVPLAGAGSYRVRGAPELAYEAHSLLAIDRVASRALDEDVWLPLSFMYPDGDVPVLQLSLVTGATPRRLYGIGRTLGVLAERGYLVMGTGAVVRNDEEAHSTRDAAAPEWAREFDSWIANHLADAEIETLLAWRTRAPHARRAHPISTLLDPLFVALGAASLYENAVGFPLRGFEHGTRSVRSVQFGRV